MPDNQLFTDLNSTEANDVNGGWFVRARASYSSSRTSQSYNTTENIGKYSGIQVGNNSSFSSGSSSIGNGDNNAFNGIAPVTIGDSYNGGQGFYSINA